MFFIICRSFFFIIIFFVLKLIHILSNVSTTNLFYRFCLLFDEKRQALSPQLNCVFDKGRFSNGKLERLELKDLNRV